MTYGNKSLRGLLVLLMAALMVLGLCSLACAADVLEDVEVDESVLSAAPTDTGDAKAAEPDEDDVEVVTQNEEADNKLTIKVVFEIDKSAIPEGSTIKFALTQADDSNKVTYISVPKSSDGDWISAATWLPNKEHFISATVVPTIEGYNYSGWLATSYTDKDDDEQLQEELAVINEGGKINGLGYYEKVLTIKLKYDKITPGTFTITHDFVDVNGQQLPGPQTTNAAEEAYFKVYDEKDTNETSYLGIINIGVGGDGYDILYKTQNKDKNYNKNHITLAPGTYKLKETRFREVPGYDFDHWEVEGPNNTYGQNGKHTFTITAGAETTLSIKNVYRVKTGKLTITKTFANLKPAGNELKFVLTSTTNPSAQYPIFVRRQLMPSLVNWTGTEDIPIGTYKIREIGGDIEDYDRTTTYKLGNNGVPASEDEFIVDIGAATSDYTTWTQVVANNSYSPKTQVPQAEYKVNYKLVKDGEMTAVGETQTYTAGDTVTLVKMPTEEGYTVTGWYDNGTFVPDSEANPQAPEGERGNLVGDDSSFGIYQNYTFYAYAEKDRPSATPKPVLPPRPIEYSAYLLINKVDAEGNPVAGAGFTVSNGSTTHGSIGLTDEQGQLLMGLLDTGDFTITETTVPEGYVAGEPVTVTVTSANTRENPCNVTIVNAKSGAQPTGTPTGEPTATPAPTPSETPTVSPTDAPTVSPTDAPTVSPTDKPTFSPTDKPTARPTDAPTARPTAAPTGATGDSGNGYLYMMMGLSGILAVTAVVIVTLGWA